MATSSSQVQGGPDKNTPCPDKNTPCPDTVTFKTKEIPPHLHKVATCLQLKYGFHLDLLMWILRGGDSPGEEEFSLINDIFELVEDEPKPEWYPNCFIHVVDEATHCEECYNSHYKRWEDELNEKVRLVNLEYEDYEIRQSLELVMFE
jgi:hypothetical protein